MTAQKAHGPQVLLVDDNPTNLQVLYQTLEGDGYRLLAARNGKDALSIAQRTIPDLILLDIMRIARLNAWDEGIVDTFVHTSLQSIAPSKLTVGRAALSHQCARVDAALPDRRARPSSRRFSRR